MRLSEDNEEFRPEEVAPPSGWTLAAGAEHAAATEAWERQGGESASAAKREKQAEARQIQASGVTMSRAIAEAATFGGVESVIYADAVKASSSPEILNARMMKRTRTDPNSGHRITEFFGPDTVFKQFSAPVMAVTQFHIPQRGVA